MAVSFNTAHLLLVLTCVCGQLLNDARAAPAAAKVENDENQVNAEENVEDIDDDAVDPAAVRSKRQINNYSDYYYYPNGVGNTNTNTISSICPFRNIFSSLGLGLNSYYNPGNQYGYVNSISTSSGSRYNRRLLRNRQPFLYNGRRGLYAPSRYYSSNRLV
ncbi:Hypothetical predicted protein [Cloeon dipterum]|uniref:Uncharacterized protein n=1 Tax=Cloeon dipterum TaxID=197152 RepID=A0A8S1DQU5_9INSE|nr:Hypothetical predicted protein [Cloeon dipterum]